MGVSDSIIPGEVVGFFLRMDRERFKAFPSGATLPKGEGQTVDKPPRPRFSEGRGVCGGTVRVPLRIQ